MQMQCQVDDWLWTTDAGPQNKSFLSLSPSPSLSPVSELISQLSVITCQKGSITKSYICICTVQKEDYYPKWIINIMKTLTTKKE